MVDKEPCAVRDCSASSKHTFCSKHRCAYFAGKACEKIADNVEFCPRHRCSLPDCTTRLPRFHDDGNYCKARKSALESIVTEAPSSPVWLLTPSVPVRQDTCAEKDCRSRVNGGNFCELHACKVGGCRSAATTDNYCTSRKHSSQYNVEGS